jgi:hypothetical protein
MRDLEEERERPGVLSGVIWALLTELVREDIGLIGSGRWDWCLVLIVCVSYLFDD